MKIILASASPRRKELLEKLLSKYNRTYIVHPSDFDEDAVKAEVKEPNELVGKLALGKALDIYAKYDEDNILVIGSDLSVQFEGEHFGKPKSKDEAFSMLKRLQGNMNEVYTGMTVLVKKNRVGKEISEVSVAKVYMKPMTDEEINWYIETGEPMDKGGSYAIQGIGNQFIEKFEGSFEGIMGLDIDKLEEMIKDYLE